MNKIRILKILMLVTALIVPTISIATAFPTEIRACNQAGCHAYPPKLLNISTDINSITVNPGENFTVDINWSGGANDGSTETAVKWPTDFSNIGITRDNSLFNITPILPALGTNASGTTSSVLTAPNTAGNYIVRVYTSTGNWAEIPTHETNFSDINVTVKPSQQISSTLTTIKISPSSAALIVNGTQTFNATALDQNNTPMPGINISWTVGNSAVGSITPTSSTTDTNGIAQATFNASEAGNTTVTASNDSVSGTANVTVTQQQQQVTPTLTTIKIAPSSATLNVNGTQIFNATALDQNNTPMPGIDILWEVADSTIGNVTPINSITDANGVSSAEFNATNIGNTTVAASNDSVVGTANVTVQQQVVAKTLTTIAVSPPSATLNVNGTQTFNATALDQNNVPIQGVNISWAVTNPAIGNITPATSTTDSNGVASSTFEAVAIGNTTVTASNENISGSANVTVTSGEITAKGQVFGKVFNDENGNGMLDQGEPGLEGWNVQLSGLDKESHKFIRMTETTDANGNYAFNNVPEGKFKVREFRMPRWIATTKSVRTVDVVSGNNPEIDFGNIRIEDFRQLRHRE